MRQGLAALPWRGAVGLGMAWAWHWCPQCAGEGSRPVARQSACSGQPCRASPAAPATLHEPLPQPQCQAPHQGRGSARLLGGVPPSATLPGARAARASPVRATCVPPVPLVLLWCRSGTGSPTSTLRYGP